MSRFVRLVTSTGTRYVNVNFIQMIQQTTRGVVVTMPTQELVIDTIADTLKLAKATKLPLYAADHTDSDTDDFKLSLWM